MLRKISGLTLMWLGIMGGVITLFANLRAPLDMADWAWGLVAPWQEWTSEFWHWFAVRLGLVLPSWLVPPLNIAALLLSTAIGVRIVDQGDQRVTMNSPFLFLIGGMVAISAIGYILLAGPSQPSGDGQSPSSSSLMIFLGSAAASFSPPLAGRGNLIKRLWFMLTGLCILVVLNELTKLGVEITAARAPT